MGKKIRYQYLTGALLEPFFHFINKVEVGINPVSDPRGTKIAEHFYKWATTTKPIFKAEKFQSNINYDFTSNSSWIIFHYRKKKCYLVNGMKQGYHLKTLDMSEFEMEQDLINKIVESTKMVM